jgi:hypothetical protein
MHRLTVLYLTVLDIRSLRRASSIRRYHTPPTTYFLHSLCAPVAMNTMHHPLLWGVSATTRSSKIFNQSMLRSIDMLHLLSEGVGNPPTDSI